MAGSVRNSGAAVVLGAGASRGALLSVGVTPPLDAEFLSVASKVNHFRRRPGSDALRTQHSLWKALQRYLSEAGLKFAEVDSWRLEQLSTYLEARATLSGLTLKAGRPVAYRHALERLKGVVGLVLAQRGGLHSCKLHQRLFETCAPTSVVSFNYDLIADQTLCKLQKLNWSLKTYGGDSQMRVRVTPAHRTVLRDLPKFSKKSHIPLFKLHGSMNWEKVDGASSHRLAGIVPSSRISTFFEATYYPKLPLIVPPVAAKTEIPGTLDRIWTGALNNLYEAPSWVIWGYSFPVTDTIAQVLFREALVNHRRLKPVVIINPDPSVARRVKDVCKKVRVEYFPSVERYLVDAAGITL